MLNEQLPSRSKRILSYTIIFLTAVYPLHPAWGAAMTAADKNTQISQQNNVPIINIATPNGAGISHNKFQQFNVDKQGAVLNNATTNVNSQIAGQIKANANLKGNAANLIINEVTGSNRSELQGKLEVAGKGANVLIANPNGITCNGCSFVNTPAITLTTGKPILDNKGALSAVEVKKGSVVIGANGLNAEAQTYADIISRATELNGQIKAKNLTLMQGSNRVDFQKGTVTPIAGEGAKPSISVDTKALGGMYANQVKLVSTESGVGINLSNVQANQHDLTLTVDGKITLAGNIQGKKDINVSTKNLQINANANVNATKDITLATNTLINNGQVTAGKDMRVFADSISNTGNSALIQAQDNLWMQKNAKGDLSTLIENKSGTIKTNTGDLVVRTKKLTNTANASPIKTSNINATTNYSEDFVSSYFGKRQGVVSIISLYPRLESFSYKKWFGKIDLINSDSINVERKQYLNQGGIGVIASGKNAYINANDLVSDFGQITAKNNVILTGQNASISVFNSGKLDHWYKYDTSYKDLGKFADESDDDGTYDIFYVSEPVDFKLIDKLYSWAPEALNYKTISAGNNVVLDFKNAINLESKLPNTEKTIAKIVQVGNPSFSITAKNIVLNSNNINISTNLQSENDLSIIAGQNININHAQLVAKQSQSLIANNDLNLKQVNLTAKDSTLIAKNGDLQYSLNPVSAFKDNVLSPPVINAANSLHIQAGKNITFDNAQLAKTNKLTLSANDNIVVRRDESNLIKLAVSESVTNINALLTKIGNWTSSGEMNLTAGKNIEARGIAFNSGKSLTFNAGQDILLGSKAIKDVDNVFKTNRYPELRSQLIANGNITLNAARDIDLQSANLQSTDKVIALSGRDIKLTATAYSAIPNPSEDNQDVRYVTSTLSGDKGITLASNGALIAQGSTIKSLSDITLSSGGNVRLESVKTNYRKQSGKKFEELYRQIGTEINSGKTLTILSEGSILFQASRLVAKGAMDIAAKGGYLYAQAMEESSYFEEYKKKCNRWTLCITKKEVRKTRSDKTNKVTEFTAGGDINLYAKDDVTLEATKINAGKNAKITSQTGKVNFKAVKNSQFEQVITNSNGFYITQRNKGYTSDKWVLPALHIGGKLTVDANKGITADVKSKNGQSLENALEALGKTEGTQWLAGLKDREDVQWNLVKDAYDSWDYKSQSLNPVAAALIMITVAAMTSGTATKFAAWAASGSSGTSAAVISGAAYSGMTALSTQAAIALAENQGNLSKALNSLGKSETVKSIVAQMVISGALNGLDVKMGWTKGNPGNAKLPLLSNGDWNKVAQRVAAQSVISSTVNTTIQGGSFTDNFKSALLSNIGNQVNAEGAKLIGDKGDILGHSGKLLGHSVVSGISAEIAGGNAKGAIVGSLAVQLAGVTLNNNLINEKEWQKDSEKYAQLSRVLGGFAGAIFTGNAGGVYSGADSGESTFRFNHLLHELAMDFDNEMQKCAGNTNCEATQIKKYAIFSLINSGNLDLEITNNPLVTQDITKTRISNAFDLAKRPYWASYLGFDVMQNDLAKQYLMYWNSQDLNKINAKTPGWTKAAVLISDPEVQASVISLGWIGKQLIQKSVFTVSKLGSDEITLMIKSTQTGLKNPSQIDQMKIDMLSNNYRFTAPEGIIAGYVDKKGIHYISEGNHRMVAAKEIYVKTGDSQYINKLIENGRWTVVESAPAGAKPLPSRN
ncbi:filamentous hemagglutinin N-terminal domain-containing protein [Escherichia coli]|nr:filamentous hemagglutinin N-terminal domain-containing protein [Escherichia coli]